MWAKRVSTTRPVSVHCNPFILDIYPAVKILLIVVLSSRLSVYACSAKIVKLLGDIEAAAATAVATSSE